MPFTTIENFREKKEKEKFALLSAPQNNSTPTKLVNMHDFFFFAP